MVGGPLMKIRTALAAFLVPVALTFSACGAQQGCYDDDGEQVSCQQFDDDDDDFEDDDEWGDDD